MPEIHQTYAAELPELSTPWRADVPPRPELVWLDEELARHAGHADILRESIDGKGTYELNALSDGEPWPAEWAQG